MVALADYIAVVGRFARSASLERDIARREPLDGYVVTARRSMWWSASPPRLQTVLRAELGR